MDRSGEGSLVEMQRRIDELEKENRSLRRAVLNQSGDNLCWMDDPEFGKTPPQTEMLESCRRFIAQKAGEKGVLSGCMTIAQLEARIRELEDRLLLISVETGRIG